MAVISYLVIGAIFALALWTLWTTLRPEMARIVGLLVDGPVLTPFLPVPVPARSTLRDARVRAVRVSPSFRHAAA